MIMNNSNKLKIKFTNNKILNLELFSSVSINLKKIKSRFIKKIYTDCVICLMYVTFIRSFEAMKNRTHVSNYLVYLIIFG